MTPEEERRQKNIDDQAERNLFLSLKIDEHRFGKACKAISKIYEENPPARIKDEIELIEAHLEPREILLQFVSLKRNMQQLEFIIETLKAENKFFSEELTKLLEEKKQKPLIITNF